MTVEIYSHFFRLVNVQPEMVFTINEFMKPLVQYEVNRSVKNKVVYSPNKIFASKTSNASEYRFHINQIAEFMELLKLKYVNPDSIEILNMPLYKPAKLSYKYRIDKQPRDYQVEVIDHIVSPMEGHRTRLAGLPTGTGKTFCGLSSAVKIGTRTMIIILPIYIEKWISDIQDNLNVDKNSIMSVQGSAHLKGLIDMGNSGTLKSDYIIVSVRTLQNFIDRYENYADDCIDEYGCRPEDLYRITGTGQVLIDETHQHIHAIYKIMLFMHVPHLTALSATLISDDYLIKKVHNIMYPKVVRYDKLLMEKYIRVFPIDYTFRDFKYRKIQTSEFGTNSYSHNAFEKSILRNPRNLDSYVAMVADIADMGYIRYYEEGDKLLIFASTTAMCVAMAEHLKIIYKDLVVKKYTQEDPYENLIDSDIIVTTPQSAGTAVDIPNLTTVIATVAISSSVSNIQMLGRLRKIKDKTVRYFYTFCRDIKKHIEIDYKRIELFKDRVYSIKNLQYPKQL